jgi:hypothetical protein
VTGTRSILRWAEKGSLGVLIFLAAFGFNTIIGLDRRMTKMEGKDKEDGAQWNRLQQQDEKVMDLQIQVTVLRELGKMRRELEKEYDPEPRRLEKLAMGADDDDDREKPEILKKQPATEILLKKLEELKHRESLKDYRDRHMLEQRAAPRK